MSSSPLGRRIIECGPLVLLFPLVLVLPTRCAAQMLGAGFVQEKGLVPPKLAFKAALQNS